MELNDKWFSMWLSENPKSFQMWIKKLMDTHIVQAHTGRCVCRWLPNEQKIRQNTMQWGDGECVCDFLEGIVEI